MRSVLALLCSLTVASFEARADEPDPAYLAFGVGYFDVVNQDDPAADFRVEYRSDLALWLIKPWVGLEVTSDGAVYGAGGLLLDLRLGDFVITPGAGVGAYAKGNGRDLGSVLQFRTQIELAYQFADRSRLGVYFSHLSNADVGDSNPGTEVLGVTYMIPTDWLF